MERADMMALRLLGASYREIAQQAGLSRQRVQQILQPPHVLRRQVMKRADYRCETCGILSLSLHVHHRGSVGLEPDTYDDAENLQVLCPGCHRRAHTGTDRPAAPTPVLVEQPPIMGDTPRLMCPAHPHIVLRCAACMGRRGGQAKSAAKSASSRANIAKATAAANAYWTRTRPRLGPGGEA